MLASRGIYLTQPTQPQDQNSPAQAQKLANQIAGYPGVVYAEPDQNVQLADTEFYGWPYGSPSNPNTDPATWTDQPAALALQLAAAHSYSQGAAITVAVLDTGADPTAPALAGHLLTGWNYVEDNADTNDTNDTTDNQVVGHGTFVSGLITLVAPQAQILPERVLNSDGIGNIFTVAQAILDATSAGAQIINLSFGASGPLQSPLIADAIKQAQQTGVLIVAATGNDSDNKPHFPAAYPGVLSVSALNTSFNTLATFSDWGPWADVAAPGEQVVGPLPNNGYATWAGTSMAAPFAAGQAALLRAATPTLSAAQIINAIEHTATQMTGNATHFGAINIIASLTFAAEGTPGPGCPPPPPHGPPPPPHGPPPPPPPHGCSG